LEVVKMVRDSALRGAMGPITAPNGRYVDCLNAFGRLLVLPSNVGAVAVRDGVGES
jgi:hypothetical protein